MFKKFCVTSVGFLMALFLSTLIVSQAMECPTDSSLTSTTESCVLQRRGGNDEENQKRQVYQEEMKKRWDCLSKEQKAQVYELKQKELEQKFATIDKLSELGVTDESHATLQKKRMQERFNEMKSNGEFPCCLSGAKRNK